MSIFDDIVREHFLSCGLIAAEQMEAAVETQRDSGQSLAFALVSGGFIEEVTLLKELAKRLDMPAVDLSMYAVDPKIAKLIPSDYATKRSMLPLKRDGRTLTVAVADPLDLHALDDIKFITRYDIVRVLGGPVTLPALIDRAYPAEDVQFSDHLYDLIVEESTGEYQSPAEPEPVSLGASAPTSAGPGDEFTARFAAYPPDEEDRVRELLTSLSPGAEPRLGIHNLTWRRGTEVTVRVHGRGLEIGNDTQTFTWDGARKLLDFDVVISGDARVGSRCVLKYDVAIAGVLVATIRLDLLISAQHGVGSPAAATMTAPRTAFASYASQDRDRVADRVSTLESVAGMNIFLDHLALTTGEKWQDRLGQEIRSRDIFLLFWSSHARTSEWVTWEWQTALRERGIDVILPQPLEPVTSAPPPEELSALHFGDRYLLLRR